MIQVKKITKVEIKEIIPLFDAYRVFYKMQSDLDAASKFLNDRINKKDSIIFGAYTNDKAVGFTQLYYTFSSVSLQKSLILNDLYVDYNFRKQSIGEQLLLTAKEFCKENKYKGLALETAIDNPAQKLYEKLGWQKDLHAFHYFWQVK